MRKIKLATAYSYHIYSRGVDKRKIFLGNKDYYRFIRALSEFNDENYILNFKRRTNSPPSAISSRKSLVDIVCFCLMPNHFHLILKQLVENGISKFMHKLNMGYAKHFNEKAKRSGSLFESRFKAILIEREEYFMHLSRYIHLNPLGLKHPNWKEEGIRDWKEADEFLGQYRWSSYLDYTGKKNFPSVINKELLSNYFKEATDYKKFIRESGDQEAISHLVIE